MQSHPDAIGGHYPERRAARRFSPGNWQKKIERLAVQSRRETAKAKKLKPLCQCGDCPTCRQRQAKRDYEARNRERKLLKTAPSAVSEAAPREPLSTAPDIAFLDRLIASNWGDVPRTLLPDEVAQAVEAGMLPPEPSFEIVWAAERSPGSLAGAIEKWVESRATANG